MKFVTSLILLSIAFCSFFEVQSVSASGEQYCRIMTETYLFKSAETSLEMENVFFTLEETYFAKVQSEQDNFYEVSYNGVTGFVLKDDVMLIDGTPITPYPENITFDINKSVSLIVRSLPSENGEYLGLLLYGASAEYIAQTTGQEMVTGLGNVWYYISYKSLEQGVISGYVYAGLTENLTEIVPNTEEFSQATSGGIEEIISPELLDTNNLLIILGLCVAGVVLLLALLLPLRRNKREKEQVANKTQLTFDNNKIDNNDFDF